MNYVLPLPWELYAGGAGLAVALSFIALRSRWRGSSDALGLRAWQVTISERTARGVRLLSLLIMATAIFAGFLGPRDPYQNLLITYFWIWFVLGACYASILIGNINALVNPWLALADLGMNWDTAAKSQVPFHRKHRASTCAASTLLFVLVWIELFGALSPPATAVVLMTYTLVTAVAVRSHGPTAWFRPGHELFTTLFELFATYAPIRLVVRGGLGSTSQLPRAGQRGDASIGVFAVVLLASTLYDGLLSSFVREGGEGMTLLLVSVGLAVFISAILLAIAMTFGLCCIIGKTSNRFLYEFPRCLSTFVPIALAYHFAHYFSFLVAQGGQLARLASDPFDRGWDIFGTVSWSQAPTLVDMNVLWHVQVVAILVGHIWSVSLSHKSAELLTQGSSAHKGLLQLPMLALMIALTVFGLWVLSLQVSGVAG